MNGRLLIKYRISRLDLELLEVLANYYPIHLEDLVRFYVSTPSRSIEMVKAAVNWALCQNRDIMDYIK